MEYASGRVGRTFAIRFDHGEDILGEMESLCLREGVESAFFFLFGAISDADVVVGPEGEALPPIPVFEKVSIPSEIVGIGSVAKSDGNLAIHLHSSLGSKEGPLVGCVRERAKAFIVTECLIFEVEGVSLSREMDEKTGLRLLKIR